MFPSGTVIKRGEYLLIVADKSGDGLTELNTGFGLSKSGETVILSTPDGTVLQSLEVPPLKEDTTYGRSLGGEYLVMPPSPDAANIFAVAEPVFSLKSGFYSENDVNELTINSTDKVYYTLDGSVYYDQTTINTQIERIRNYIPETYQIPCDYTEPHKYWINRLLRNLNVKLMLI